VPGRKYQVPGGEAEYFTFDRQPGTEKLFILLSKTPVKDLDAFIVNLNPASAPPARKTQTIETQNQLDDQLVAKLRNAVPACDLVFTRINGKPAAAAGAAEEKAMYMVNRNSPGQSNSRIVVDLTLKHQ